MNDPLDEIVSICEELRTIRIGMYRSYDNYIAPKPSDMNKLDNAIIRLDRVIKWIDSNVSEVKQ